MTYKLNKGGDRLTISELQKNCLMNDSVMTEFKEAHPKQIISTEVPIPVWKVTYKYKTNRDNDKTAIKYVILKEDGWDLIDMEFMKHIEEENRKHPERKISNVAILDTKFLGEVFLQLE